MNTFPTFQMGASNGWLPLILYLVGFVLTLATFSKEAKARLFADPKQTLSLAAKCMRLLGQAAMFIYIGMMIFTPLSSNKTILLIGGFIYAGGYAVVIAALVAFKNTPPDRAVVAGPYHLSRNPQWVGLVLVLAGSAAMTGIWLHIGIILAVAIIYHLQILAEEKVCLTQYGDSYREYMASVPRYFLFL